ncbi:efflux RND transporter periplasmic adaptor subunit [Bacteroides sp. 214]|uniref:efflux RND transporter periplasmic adaptor subunit n=1 Tax=Bacteroides sp. 214 TaxID=2302935 RepID=UPI0013D139FD|nr:efflux RND transporter periplasmic adaptor subunit [Bacteroides sp. 214]NDW12552.1 efflux RND transporter periplasmic adaptor subunit [Bacteroides sp. 214]
MNKRTRWIIIALAGACLIGFAMYKFTSGNDISKNGAPVAAEKNAGRKALNVNAEVVKMQNLVDDLKTKGRLIPDEEVDLSFQTSGLITTIYFQEGSFVKKGQLLVKVNDAPLQAQLMKLEAQLKLAEDRVFRQNTLLQKDAVSQEAYQQVKTDLASLHADIALVKANIDLTELRAPFDGVIGLRQVSEGAYASPSVVIAKLTKTSPMKIEFSFSERYSGEIGPGTKILFSLTNNPHNIYTANIYALESSIYATTNTLTARAIYPNQKGELLSGRTVDVTVRMMDIPDAITIPSQAIVPEMGVDKVFLYKGGKAQPVAITKGLRTADRVQVLSGLSLGDTLITSGTLQLRTGLTVTLDNIN